MGALSVRRAEAEDLPALLDIQAAAAARFARLGLIATPDGMPETIPINAFQRAALKGLLFLAEDGHRRVGFALCSIERPDLYLDQISVIPDAGRKGVGTALLNTVSREAGQRGLWGVSLSTFRDVPWNAPFFARLDFQEIPRAGLALWQLDIERAQAEIMDAGARCFMRKPTIQAIDSVAA